VTEGVDAPLLHAIGTSNEQQIRNAVKLIVATGKNRIGVLGFAFKGGTDDLRESPVVAVIEALLGKGLKIKLYDSFVSLARLIGANRRYIEEHIPHISRLMVDSIPELVAGSQLILIGNKSAEFDSAFAILSADQHIIDLTGGDRPHSRATYERVSG
jgi:GDP-mannose 6-dehydrogenase